MRKIIVVFCVLAIFLFSACSLTGGSSSNSSSAKKVGSLLKSIDGGKIWENKIKVSEKTNIGSVNVLSMSVSSKDGNIVYLGTEKDGLFVTKDGAENWEKLVFPLTRIYGLAIDRNDDQIIYASGILDSRSKIFKSTDGGGNWTEIYTEPGNSSVISSLEIGKKDSGILYCGTSEGVIIKTSDGGQSWKNIFKASGPVIEISFDVSSDNAVYFGISKGGVFRTLDGGAKIEDLGKTGLKTASNRRFSNFNVNSIEADPKTVGVFYIGTDKGMFRAVEFGNKLEEVNILESSKKFPIRAISVNPQNSNEIIYSNSQVIYRSTDAGITWLTFQLNTDKVVEVLEYDPFNAGNIYAGLRKI